MTLATDLEQLVNYVMSCTATSVTRYNQPKYFRIHIKWDGTLPWRGVTSMCWPLTKALQWLNVIAFLHAECRVGLLVLSAAAAFSPHLCYENDVVYYDRCHT